MYDVYLMNRETGELLPSSQAIREFYKTHNAMDNWYDEWIETDIPTGEYMSMPCFTSVLAV